MVQGVDWHGGGVLFVMLGSVGLLEWGISVVVFSVGEGPWVDRLGGGCWRLV